MREIKYIKQPTEYLCGILDHNIFHNNTKSNGYILVIILSEYTLMAMVWNYLPLSLFSPE